MSKALLPTDNEWWDVRRLQAEVERLRDVLVRIQEVATTRKADEDIWCIAQAALGGIPTVKKGD